MARANSKADEKLLKIARDRWKLWETAEDKQLKREQSDLEFYAGKQWPDDLLKARAGTTIGSGTTQQTVPARPSLVINRTIEPVRQVINEERQSDLGFELIPADDFGELDGAIDHSEIEFREGLCRRIQRDSEASDARTWAFMRAAIAGRGYYVILTRYLPGKSQDQEIYIERIYNQSSVRLDPSAEQPDGSDVDWGFYGTDMLWSKFKDEFPDAKASGTERDDQWRSLCDEYPGWFTGENEGRAVRLMNYYYAEREAREVYHLSDGTGCFEEDLATLEPGVTVLTEDGSDKPITHTDTRRTVKWCKIVGNEILERTDWPGRWIPILRIMGEELQPFDQERRAQGVVRPMRDSCSANNYIMSKFVERYGLTPIPPWMMAAGQDEGYEDEYNAANTRTLSRLHYNQKDSEDMQAPPPFRTDMRAEVGDLAMGVQIFGQAISATSVTPETALGHIDPSVKSGKLARALIDQSSRGTSNFMDNLVRTMRHEARVINDLLYPVMGRMGRPVRILNGQGEQETALIGVPFMVERNGESKRIVPLNLPQGAPLPPGAKLFTLTPDADFNVAEKISKNIDTRRQQIVTFLGELIGADPSQMMIIGDKLWQYLDVPDHDEIEKRYRVMLAPPIQKLLSGDAPIPPEAQAQIAALQQQLEAVMPLADKNVADLHKTQMQESEETKRAEMKTQADDSRARLDSETKLAVAELGAKVDRLALFLEERARVGLQIQEGTESELQRQHEREMAAQEHQQSLEQGAQQHASAVVQNDQQQQGAIEQQQVAAALAPEPSQES